MKASSTKPGSPPMADSDTVAHSSTAMRYVRRPPGFTRSPGRPVTVIDQFPPYVNTDEVGLSITNRAQERAWHAFRPDLGARSERTVVPYRSGYRACSWRKVAAMPAALCLRLPNNFRPAAFAAPISL